MANGAFYGTKFASGIAFFSGDGIAKTGHFRGTGEAANVFPSPFDVFW
jgi:hypothetical protein